MTQLLAPHIMEEADFILRSIDRIRNNERRFPRYALGHAAIVGQDERDGTSFAGDVRIFDHRQIVSELSGVASLARPH